MKRVLTLILIFSVLLIGCVDQKCTLSSDCEGMPHANCTSDWLCIDGKCVWGCGECSLSLCDCKCYLKGETPEEKTGELCGINCLSEFNVSGCEYRNGKCVEIYKEPVECTQDPDCGTGGCSGQICGLKEEVGNITTTCEYRPEYDCLQLTSCKCINGECKWEENDAYLECMENLNVGIANPASVYCEEQGYDLEMRTDENGSYGVCIFPDGSECEEWSFFRRECNYTLLTQITEEEAISIANQTEEVQEFLKLYPDANLTTDLDPCCPEIRVGGGDCECPPEPRYGWVVTYYKGDDWSSAKSTAVRIAINSTSGEILAKYPKLEYIRNETYCEYDEDCVKSCCSPPDTLNRACCLTYNFIHAFKECGDYPEELDVDRNCEDSRCSPIPTEGDCAPLCSEVPENYTGACISRSNFNNSGLNVSDVIIPEV
jgi:eight-cysteine-cluster-containing protein